MFSEQKYKWSHLAKSLDIFKFHLFFMSTKTEKSISQRSISVSQLLNCCEKADFQTSIQQDCKSQRILCVSMPGHKHVVPVLQELGAQSVLSSTVTKIFSELYLVYTFCFQNVMTNTTKTSTLQKAKTDVWITRRN